MNYHNITCPDQNNGDGLRVVLWVSGCSHHCDGCQNPQTWNTNSGIPFDKEAMLELLNKLGKDYISGLTLSGGDPLNENNINTIVHIISKVKELYPEKTIWLYTGYTLDELIDSLTYNIFYVLNNIDVLVDGKFEKSKADRTYPWAGSINQNVIRKDGLKSRVNEISSILDGIEGVKHDSK